MGKMRLDDETVEKIAELRDAVAKWNANAPSNSRADFMPVLPGGNVVITLGVSHGNSHWRIRRTYRPDLDLPTSEDIFERLDTDLEITMSEKALP